MSNPTDWQYSHSENGGKTHVVIDFNTDADDTRQTRILVTGRDGERIANRLVELLQREQFDSSAA